MTDTSRYSFVIGAAAWGALALAGVAGGLLWRGVSALPAAVPPVPAVTTDPVFDRVKAPIGLDWAVFQGGGEPPPAGSELARRYRLAGTFFVTDDGGLDIRKAVLDIVRTGEQRIVVEGDRIDEAAVLRISRDRVVLRAGAVEETLSLSFTEGAGTGGVATAAADGGHPARTGGAGRFGEEVAADNWVFNRKALMDYYNELWDAPERMLQVFDSLKPIYGENDAITGYQLGIEGERDFFDAVGFREGDVVRKVNSLPMTNRGRAENFIDQFARNRMNVFVIDIEREGKSRRLVYRIR